MKKLSLFMLSLITGASVFAQSNSLYEAAMKKNISVLDTTENLFALETVANNFERIASVKKDQWLPYYCVRYTVSG